MARRDVLSQDHVQPDASTNLALWLDRYLWAFDQETARAHLEISLDRIRIPEGYARAFETRKQALRTLTGGYQGGETRLYTVALTGRAILGIGTASVRETHLSLLRPWGVPYLAGSAFKGLASHTVHVNDTDWARPEEPGEKAGVLHRALFGDVTEAGAVIFHDAWWIPPGKRRPIELDTMTVHHMDYYSGTVDAPADWDEPNPVAFLTATGCYLLALSGPAEALDLVEKILAEALKNRGIGAKTAAGYGRATLECSVSEVTRKLNDYQRPTAQPNTVAHLTSEFLRVAQEATSPEEITAARKAAQRMREANPKVWRTWLQDKRCPPEARTWFSEPTAAPPPAPTAPPAAPSPSTPSAPKKEERKAVAWIAPDTNRRPTLYVKLSERNNPLGEELRKLQQQPDEETRKALEAASQSSPREVWVELNVKKRVLSVRLA
jgi:CRISPR-associated protein Cmr6